MMVRFWNGKIKGIPAALTLFIRKSVSKIYRTAYSKLIISNFGECGKKVMIFPRLKYGNPKSIKLGNNIVIGKDVSLSNGEMPGGTIHIEDGASIDFGCFIDYSGGVILHKGAHVAWGVYISTHDHGYDYKAKPIGKPLKIGENAFVGAKSIILHNCNYIGRNAVVGTGSVVTKDVPDDAIVAGNPARIIKYRDK